MASAACPATFSTPSCALLEALSKAEREGKDKKKVGKMQHGSILKMEERCEKN